MRGSSPASAKADKPKKHEPRVQYAGSRRAAREIERFANPQTEGRSVSAPACGGRVRRACLILGWLNLWAGVRDFGASTPALLLFVLTRFSCQLPLLSCLMIVRLCHDFSCAEGSGTSQPSRIQKRTQARQSGGKITDTSAPGRPTILSTGRPGMSFEVRLEAARPFRQV